MLILFSFTYLSQTGVPNKIQMKIIQNILNARIFHEFLKKNPRRQKFSTLAL